jgi:hypothetical protein
VLRRIDHRLGSQEPSAVELAAKHQHRRCRGTNDIASLDEPLHELAEAKSIQLGDRLLYTEARPEKDAATARIDLIPELGANADAPRDHPSQVKGLLFRCTKAEAAVTGSDAKGNFV